MKLLDKIKDLFMDEVTEEDEMELEEEQKVEFKEPSKDTLPKIMRDTIKKEEEIEEKVELRSKSREAFQQENILPKEEPIKKFSFPVDLEDELPNMNNRKNSNVNVLNMEKEMPKKVVELYPKKEEVKEKTKFKATPVISPVYGILDKNYRKEEVKEKTDDISIMIRPSKKVDFETVRKKAFGNLADEIKDNLMCENCELYKEAKKNNLIREGDLLYDMTVDSDSDEVTIEKAYDNYEEFGVEYEPKDRQEEKEIDVNQEEKEVELEEEVVSGEDSLETEIKKEISLRSNKTEVKNETKVDDDFFELIDSMYKERSDE